jgi:hypothetical protein
MISDVSGTVWCLVTGVSAEPFPSKWLSLQAAQLLLRAHIQQNLWTSSWHIRCRQKTRVIFTFTPAGDLRGSANILWSTPRISQKIFSSRVAEYSSHQWNILQILARAYFLEKALISPLNASPISLFRRKETPKKDYSYSSASESGFQLQHI